MIVNVFKGQVLHNRSRMSAYLRFKETELFWIDQIGRKFRKTDGSIVNKPALSGLRLLLSTITRHDAPRDFHAWTLTARIKRQGMGAAKPVFMRETAQWYIDEYGVKYDKETGWSPDQEFRFVLDSVKRAKLISESEINEWEKGQRKNRLLLSRQ